MRGLAAVAMVNHVADGTHTYQGQTRYNRRVTKAEIYVPKQPWYYAWGSNHYRSAFTHELGHGLGWLGHSSDSNDVMYHDNRAVTTLTNRDKNHLVQNY